MAIVSVRALFENRSASEDWRLRWTGSRVFEVISDDANEADDAILSAVDPVDPTKFVPNYGDAHPGKANAVCVSKDLDTSDETPYIHYVNVGYDTDPDVPAGSEISPGNEGSAPGEVPGNREENPLNRPVEWRFGGIERQEVVRRWLKVKQDGTIDFLTPPDWVLGKLYKVGDYVKQDGNVYRVLVGGVSAAAPEGVTTFLDGTLFWAFHATLLEATTDPRFAIYSAVVNSGHVPFNPALTTDVGIVTVIFTKNVPLDRIDLLYAMRIRNAVNIAPWKGLPARCAKVLKFDGGNKKENGVEFFAGTWEIGIDPLTWDLRPLDSGFGFLELSEVLKPNPTPPPAKITVEEHRFKAFRAGGASEEPVSEPVPMDGSGGMLSPDADPVFLRGIPEQQQMLDFAAEIPW